MNFFIRKASLHAIQSAVLERMFFYRHAQHIRRTLKTIESRESDFVFWIPGQGRVSLKPV